MPYLHLKSGKLCEIVTNARLEEDQVHVVVYRFIVDPLQAWVSPAHVFNEQFVMVECVPIGLASMVRQFDCRTNEGELVRDVKKWLSEEQVRRWIDHVI